MNRKEELFVLKQEMAIRKAREDFYTYCRLTYPGVYRKDRPHLKKLCNKLQALYERKLLKPDGTPYRGIIINLPPRHVKSFTVQNFSNWILGKNKFEKIIATSYNETLSQKFGKQVRDVILTQKADPYMTIYQDIFDTKIKEGEGAVTLWAVEGSYMTFLGTSPGGTVTGFGCSVLIIDDLIKNAYEAMHEGILEDHWTYYNDTLKSRKEEGAIEIIIMTRWATGDLAGRILESDEADDYYLMSEEAYNEETDTMLCESLLSKETYMKLRNGDMSTAIFMANYHQKPIDIEGRLYDLKPYSEIPKVIRDGKEISVLDLPNADIRSVCDTADTGADYLCNIIYLVWEGEAYVLDVYYTKDPQEITEVETARRLDEFHVRRAKIESNNGGRAFARNVERILWEKFKNRSCKVEWFHQTQNKEARIKSHSSFVNNHIFYPPNFKNKYKDYTKDMEKYQSGGKNEHDDAPDCTTMIAEDLETKNKVKTLKKAKLGI